MKTHRIILVFLAVVVLISFSDSNLFAQPKFITNIGSVKTSMSKSEVKRILGTPYTIDRNVWRYQSNSSSGGNDVLNYLVKGVIKKGLEEVAGRAMAGGGVSALNRAIAPSVPGVASGTSSLLTSGNNYSAKIVFNNDSLVEEVWQNGRKKITSSQITPYAYEDSRVSDEMKKTMKNAPVYSSIVHNPVVEKSVNSAPYYSINGLVHKPDCKTIMEIEKNKMDRTATLSEALEKGSEACPECCGDEPIVKLVNRHHVTSIDVANEAVDSHDVYVVDGIIHFDKRCPHLIDTEYVTILESNLKGDKIPHFCETKDIW